MQSRTSSVLLAIALSATAPILAIGAGCNSRPGSDLVLIDTGLSDSSFDNGDNPDSLGDVDDGDSAAGGCDPHVGDECNLLNQTCTDLLENCVYDPKVDHNVCLKVPIGTGGKGDWCDSSNPCNRGLFCIGDRCSPACCVGDSRCGSAGRCDTSITTPVDGGTKVVYHVCSYSQSCNPFKYDCRKGENCLYTSPPGVFSCSKPAAGVDLFIKPGGTCKYRNDCGESQGCISFKADAGPSDYGCYLFCWVTKPDGFTVGTYPAGRFPADGTCDIGAVSYGTCTAVSGITGGLGVCIK